MLEVCDINTFYGKAMEAVSTDTLGTDLVGIPRDLIIMLSFGISAAIGAVAGILITPLELPFLAPCQTNSITLLVSMQLN